MTRQQWFRIRKAALGTTYRNGHFPPEGVRFTLNRETAIRRCYATMYSRDLIPRICAGAQAVSEDVQLNLVTNQASVRPSAASKSPKPTADSSSPHSAGATAG